MSFLLQENGDKILQETGDGILLEDFTLFAVFNDVIGKYDILGLVNNDLILKYDIIGLVNNDVIGKYDILNLVNNDLIGKYDILDLVFNTIIGKYDIKVLATNDVIGKYDINGLVNSDSIGKYDITGNVTNTLGGCYDINGVASAIIQKQTKTIQLLQNGVESIVVEKTDGAFNYSCWLFLDNMLSGDEVVIRTYVWNPQQNIYELYESPIVKKSDLPGLPTQSTDDKTAFFIPPVQSDRFKVTISQTVGTPKAFDWVLYKQ